MKHYRTRGPLLWSMLLLGQVSLIGAIAISQVSAAGTRHAPAMAQASAAPTLVVLLHRHVVQVSIGNFAFHPARLEVSPGTRIVWTNTDSDPHTVDSTRNVWSSDALDTQGHFARMFAKTGTFPYYCSIHPFMHGTVIVKG